ncbi:MAG: phospholipase D family protein [Bacteriovorax sp.]|nr:phospholipase D family protein [Bacteriovorax sp.]
MKILAFITFIITFILFQTMNAFAEEDESAYRTTVNKDHEMRIITSGSAALNARIQMIRDAKTSIEMEYFIFNHDTSGGLVLKELATAAKRGVKIRLLVDKSVNASRLDEYYAQAVKENGIDIRYYNPAPMIKFGSIQFRNHRKLIVKDGEEAITGGRNIGDDYFDLSEDFNFLDREASIKGEIVGAMKNSFEKYWASDIVEAPGPIQAPYRNAEIKDESRDHDYQYRKKLQAKRLQKARDIFKYTPKDEQTLAFIMDEGKKNLEANIVGNCPNVTFATDREGASFLESLKGEKYEDKYRLLRKEIAKWVDDKVDKELVIDSPYFLENTLSKKIRLKLIAANKKITILTNSLASTDAIHVSSIFNDDIASYMKDGNFHAYIYKGESSAETKFISPKVKSSSWGTHSKTMVYNNDSFMIGTFNIDNRSSYYNTEMAIFCSGSPELAKDVMDNINLRKKSSTELMQDGSLADCTELTGGAKVGVLKKLMYYLSKIPSRLFINLL